MFVKISQNSQENTSGSSFISSCASSSFKGLLGSGVKKIKLKKVVKVDYKGTLNFKGVGWGKTNQRLGNVLNFSRYFLT